jgi:sec-independent protein translocase protein TatA
VTPLGLLDIGPIELLLLAAAAVMLFGGELPDMARRAGKALGKLRATARELSRQIDLPPDVGQLPTEPWRRPARTLTPQAEPKSTPEAGAPEDSPPAADQAPAEPRQPPADGATD